MAYKHMADPSGEKPESTNPWMTLIQEGTKTATPRDQATDEEISKLFAKWMVPLDPAQGDVKSKMLDSPDMESRYAVNKLMKKPDGTTVVHYYFSNDSAEANALSMGDPLVHSESTALKDDNLRKLAREAMTDIVAESGAKIQFDEVHSLAQADISFVQSPHPIVADDDNKLGAGAAGRAHNKNFIDVMDEHASREKIEQAFSLLSPEQGETAKRAIKQIYGDRYGRDTDIFTILASEAEKKLLAHEIEHILGAKHPDAPGGVQVTEGSDPQTYRQSIMGESVVVAGAGINRNALGRTLGSLDVEWYERHFGVRDLPDGTLPTPSSTSIDRSAPKKER
jgi:hypothetical protein